MNISKICLLIVICVLLAGCGDLYGPQPCNVGNPIAAVTKTTEPPSTHLTI